MRSLAQGAGTDRRRDGACGSPASSADWSSVKLARRLGEVRLRRSLDPVSVVAVIDLVHVRVRGSSCFDFFRASLIARHASVALRPSVCDLLLDVEVAHELLRDRRPALHDLPRLDVRVERAHDAEIVEGTVVVETPVLDRDRRLRHPLADLVERDRLAVAFRRNRSEQRSVRREDERVLADLHRLEDVEVAAVHPDGRAREARDDEEEHRADEHARSRPCRAASAGSSRASGVACADARAGTCPSCGRRSARRRGHA